MMNRRLAIRSLFILSTLAAPGVVHAQIGFADSQADRIRLWNAGFFEVAFRKADGRIMDIIDKTTGGHISPGNVHGPWVLRFSNNTWLDGEQFSASNPSRQFSYAWDAQNLVLTLTYAATGTQACNVTLTIRPTNGPELDSTLVLTNQSAMNVELLAYPVQLSHLRSQIEAIYVPYMEGMKLLPSFFPTYDFTSGYPGQMFADFAYGDLTTGAMGVYTVQDPQAPLIPSAWAILRDTVAGGVNKYHHDYTLAVGPAESWTSPTTVLSIGSTLNQAMNAYWTRNGHHTIQSLEEKLGSLLFNKLANAVLFKRDFLQGSWTFGSFQSELANIPAGNLLHFVAFWPNGFDENYPDYLPPNPSLGTLAQFQTLVSTARSSGHLVMPYTNPTWWDNQSSTLNALGTGIVARARDNSLISEAYGSHGGYVVSPHSSAVIARQDQTRYEFTQTVPCDFLFEDQVGARSSPTYADHPECPDPVQYIQGLVDVAERSSTWLPIMSEGGYDRLSRYESGFCLSHTIAWHWWPSTTFTPYPMAPLWAHDKLYFNAHNLAGNVMALDLPKLTYYVSVGYGLSYDLSAPNASWVKMLDRFQKQIVSKYIGVGMTSYEVLPTAGQTRTTFDNNIVVTANLTAATMSQGNHVIAANGFLVELDGGVLGGTLRTLNGVSLSGSAPHYLAFERNAYRVNVYQPIGDDGNMTLPRPALWTDDSRVHVVAVTTAGNEIDRTVTVGPATLVINYVGNISGQEIRFFSIRYCRSADLNCDSKIDQEDFEVLTFCMSGPDEVITPPSPYTLQQCLDAFDSDVDMDIDMIDLAAFQLQFDGGS